MWCSGGVSRRVSLCVSLCVLLGVSSVCCDAAGRVIPTPLGRVRGATVTLTGNRGTVDVYKGLPHARPPTGNLRFMAPQPPTKWSGVRDATDDNTRCLQGGHWNETFPSYEKEDCLYLDVYSPRGAQNLPVMMWIHGGSFVHGSKNNNGTVIASRGVVFVSTNYRLGTMGYFSAQDDVIPGNYGLLDQISALKWVRDNIAAFGGDPTKVTIFGESAGAMSVSLLLLSPLAQGLFARAIMESGVSGMTSGPKLDSHARQVAIETGKSVNCTMPPGQDFLKCLQSKDVLKLFRVHAKAQRKYHVSGGLSSGPMVDRVANSLPDYPHNLLTQGKFAHVSTMRGTNSGENGQNDPGNDGITLDEFRAIVNKFYHPGGQGANQAQLVERVVDAYISNRSDVFEIRAAAVKFRTDMVFGLSTVVETQANAQFQTAGMKTFLYKFNYKGFWLNAPDWRGVKHTAEIPFVFGFAAWSFVPKEDLAVADVMLTMWTNFAKYGDPTPPNKIHSPMVQWKPFTNDDPAYLLIEDTPTLLSYDTPGNLAMLGLYNLTQSHFPKPVTDKPDAVVGK